jgi:hypothetical protein
MFHSVYGTFDYRSGIYDLRNGRSELRSLIGPGAEELAFAICTSDRIGLLCDLMGAMYGPKNMSKYGVMAKHVIVNSKDGNPLPPLIGSLSEEGFPVRNHITQQVHILPPDLFAQFALVMIADFMDQGVVGVGSADMDICLFHFIRYRFYNDLLRFVSKYLRVVPEVWTKYLWDKDFVEPTRNELKTFMQMWDSVFHTGDNLILEDKSKLLAPQEKNFLCGLITTYPYLLEPRVLLGMCMACDDVTPQVRKSCLCYVCQNLTNN